MNPTYEERPSDSPFVESFGWGLTDSDGATMIHADSQWYMIVMRQQDKARLAVGGPVTKTWYLPYTAGTEWFGIRFTTGTFMPHLPTAHFLNDLIFMPEATHQSFWLNSCLWELPTLENAESFVNRLAREDVLVCDPTLNAVLLDQPQAISFSTLRRRCLRATGLTPGVIRQIQRVRKATMLLTQGVSILDTVYETGYFDQPHLNRSLKQFMGYTPAQIVRAYQSA